MQRRYGLLAELVAAPGEGMPWRPSSPRPARQRPGKKNTVTWYAFNVSDTTYGIVDTFASEDDRNAHLAGGIPLALAAVASRLLAAEPAVRAVNIVAVK